MRLSFKSGFFVGGLKASAMTLTGGLAFSNKIDIEEDAREEKIVTPESQLIPDGTQTFSKQDAVFRSGNNTRDSIPSHLSINSNTPLEVTKFYEKMCPAAVYEHHDEKFVINHSNCIDCKTTDVLGPRWRPREGGSGTKYKRM